MQNLKQSISWVGVESLPMSIENMYPNRQQSISLGSFNIWVVDTE